MMVEEQTILEPDAFRRVALSIRKLIVAEGTRDDGHSYIISQLISAVAIAVADDIDSHLMTDVAIKGVIRHLVKRGRVLVKSFDGRAS